MANARTEGHKMTIFSPSNLTALGYNSARELCFLMKLFCEFWDVAEAVFTSCHTNSYIQSGYYKRIDNDALTIFAISH